MKRILFVDDETRVLEGLQRMFRPQRKEWEMSFANNGKEALAFLRMSTFDVIVTDMRMPEMDGATLLEHVQEMYPSVVRIVLSGHVEMQTALRAASVAHQFLSKPCDAAELRKAIENAFACRASLPDESTRRVIGAVGKLPSLPATCAALLSALEQPEVDLLQVGKIIEQDVAIAAKVLQLANSAFFGNRSAISHIRAAVNFLGSETLKHLILSVELLRTFQPPPGFGFSLSEFDTHSRTAAQIARCLPVAENLACTATVAVLLHDTGKLVLATRLAEEFELALRTASERRAPLHMVEEEIMGTTHAQVGAYLLNLWGLPDSIVEAARDHHQPAAKQESVKQLDIVGITHVADALAHELKEDVPGRAASNVSLLDTEYLEALGMANQLPVWRELACHALEVKV